MLNNITMPLFNQGNLQAGATFANKMLVITIFGLHGGPHD